MAIKRILSFGLGAIFLLASFASAEADQAAAMLLSTQWTETKVMQNTRELHTLSVLPDGTALAAGGYSRRLWARSI